MKKLNVKVGDKVIVHSNWNKRVSKVEKITPTGLIKVDGTLYYDYGSERGGNAWSQTCISEYSDEEAREIMESNYIRKTIKKLRSIETLTYNKAVEINNLLESETVNENSNT